MPPSSDTPGTYAFSQKQFIEPLADYLVSIRGPDSSDKIPFKQRPRPTDAASTNLVVTEYALPRGGERELYMLRGDRRFVWPHDVIMNDKYAYYTDHFSYVLGRVDLKTGEGDGDALPAAAGSRARRRVAATAARAIPAAARTSCNSIARAMSSSAWTTGPSNTIRRPASSRAGRPAAPCSASIRTAMSGILQKNGELTKIDTNSEELKPTIFLIPKNKGIYDTDTDSKGRTDLYIWREGKIGIFDPKTVEYAEYKTPTPMSGPRRGQIDGQDRLWAAEFYAGQVLMFDPDKKIIKEYPLINGTKPYTAPYAEPYSASVDDKNQIVWTHDFSSSRLYRIDMNTGQSTEYMTPSNYEMRDLKVDTAARAPDRVGSGLSAAVQAGEDPGSVRATARAVAALAVSWRDQSSPSRRRRSRLPPPTRARPIAA